MDTIKNLPLFLIYGLLFAIQPLYAQDASGDQEAHPNRYFVELCQGVNEASVKALLSELNSVELWKNDDIGLRLWSVKSFPYACINGDDEDEITDIGEHVKRAKKKSDVQDVELDRIQAVAAPINDGLGYFNSLDFSADPGANPVMISILDSGISDLSGANTGEYNFALTTYTGYDYVDDDVDPDDQNGHGSHIAGLIHHIVSQKGDASNIFFDIRKTHDQFGQGSMSNLVAATVDAVEAGADIINMSFSYYDLAVDTAFNPLELAIEYAESRGVLIVASAGNSGSDSDANELKPLPASLLYDNIISVASNDGADQLSAFSNFGGQSVDLSILGENIPGPGLNGNLEYSSGTSFSTAIVTALAAVLGTRQEQFNFCEIKCLLTATSRAVPTFAGLNQAGGIIDFQSALTNPPTECNADCAGTKPEMSIDCGLNCPPETEEMNICVENGQTVDDVLLVYDKERDDLSFKSEPVYGPFNGKVEIKPDGTFSYTSINGEPDMFVYQVCDGNTVSAADSEEEEELVLQNLSRRISDGDDDAEEDVGDTPGPVTVNSADLEMVYDAGLFNADQTIGMRFTNIDIPQGAIIQSATITFEAYRSSSGAADLRFHAHNTDNAPAFSRNGFDISSRAKTAASVDWNNIPAWSKNKSYVSPDLSGVVQEVVNRSGWSSGNNFAVIVTGSGGRDAYSYDGSPSRAPLLEIAYWAPAASNPGSIEGADCCSGVNDNPQTLSLRYTGDGCEAGGHGQSYKADCAGNPQNAPQVYITAFYKNYDYYKRYFSNLPVQLNETFEIKASDIGKSKLGRELVLFLKDQYGNILQQILFRTSCDAPLSAGDQFGGVRVESLRGENGLLCELPEENFCSDGCNQGVVYINGMDCSSPNINSGESQTIYARISTKTDDVEERLANGAIYRNSPDLELAYDPNFTGSQIVGMRFNNIAIPQGAKIARAVIRFTARYHESGSISLQIKGQADDHVQGFSSNNGNISYRPLTATSVAWNEATAWSTGRTYDSPDLSGIIQEIVDRSAWEPGNSIALMVKGNGRRTAWSYDGNASLAPELEITYYENESEGESENCCEGPNNAPQILTFQYTGSDCNATSHQQDPSQVDCTGDPQNAPFVYITAKSKSKNGRTYIRDLQVPLRGSFDISAADVGAPTLKSVLYIYLKDAAGNELQKLTLNASCSQPLNVGNRFGGLLLEGVQTADGAQCGKPPVGNICSPMETCECEGKRSVVGFMYTGAGAASVRAYHKSENREYLGAYKDVDPGDFIAFSSWYINKAELNALFLEQPDGVQIEIPTDCGTNILGQTYGDFMAVYQSNKSGDICHIPYSSCIEVNMTCGPQEENPAVAQVREIPDLFVPLMTEQNTEDVSLIEKDVLLYPNPAREVVYLNLADFAGQPVDIAIYDAVSRLIKHIRVDEAGAAATEIDLRTISDGLYTAVVQAEGEPPVLRKLVIAR